MPLSQTEYFHMVIETLVKEIQGLKRRVENLVEMLKEKGYAGKE